MVKVTHIPYYGYGKDYYHVTSHTDYNTVSWWMRENGVEYELVASGSNGYGFTVKTNVDWFRLKWV